ncbi:hypothetical protein BU16DRAFT_464542, partial [Lophium mytilinum]
GFIALDWTLMTVALIPILLRLSLRARHRGHHSLSTNLSDGFVLLAWLSGIVLISINTWKNNLRERYTHAPPSSIYYGVPKDQAAHLLYVSWISLFFIYISLWASKAAFLAFYYSILSLQGRTTRIVLWVASGFTLATFILHLCLIAFWCAPIRANWNVEGHLCSAVHSINSVTVSTFTNVATDLVILSIPISTLVGLRLGKAERTGLLFVFLMGSVSIVAALVRFVTLKLVEHVPRAEITHTIDVWALVEIVSSLLAVCLPSLRTFVRTHRPASRGEKDSWRSRSGSRSTLRGADGASSRGDSIVSGKLHVRTASEEIEEHYFRDVEASSGRHTIVGEELDLEGHDRLESGIATSDVTRVVEIPRPLNTQQMGRRQESWPGKAFNDESFLDRSGSNV